MTKLFGEWAKLNGLDLSVVSPDTLEADTIKRLRAERTLLLAQVQEISDALVRIGGGIADHRVRGLIRTIEGT